jgi:hypothetical protein
MGHYPASPALGETVWYVINVSNPQWAYVNSVVELCAWTMRARNLAFYPFMWVKMRLLK